MTARWKDIEAKVEAGERLSAEDGLLLCDTAATPLLEVGRLANIVRERLWGDDTFFNQNQHINYTNVCNRLCAFCAFQRLPGGGDIESMSPEVVADRVRGCLGQEVTELHMVAGIEQALPYEYYLDILRAAKSVRPSVHIKGFTMVEIDQIHGLSGKSMEACLEDLKEAGLDSCPGGGAEIFAERVHRAIFPLKIGADRWLECARAVHLAGLRSNCTMLYGHVETAHERVDHLMRLRELQDETGGFQTFIPLRFHPDNTVMDWIEMPTAADDLREIAVARLMLDNIPHIKAYWIMLGQGTAQTAQSFGADDVDGTVVEEKIYHDAGATTPQAVTRDDLERMIREAGRVPVLRDTLYTRLEPAGVGA